MSVNWIVPRDGQNPYTIGHDDVFAFADNPKTNLFQGPYGISMLDAGDLWHDYEVTSTSRTTAPFSRSSRAARYS